jgi:Predicted membrane protein
MASTSAPPVDLYIAAYPDPDMAREDWDTLKQLAKDDMIKVDGLILVSRRSDGKIHVDDDFHETRKGAKWGAVGGAVVGLIFPPLSSRALQLEPASVQESAGSCRMGKSRRSRRTSRTSCRSTAQASLQSSRNSGRMTSTARCRTPRKSPRRRSTGTAPRRSRRQPARDSRFQKGTTELRRLA